ncbi:MAG: RNA polymerase sigma factor [Emcibacter sp.]|nr:RNA polymerase sigma factor [Emcibacter sp.]
MDRNFKQTEYIRALDIHGEVACRRNRNDVLTDYYQRYKRDIRAYIYAVFNTGSFDPEDVIQQIFVKATEMEDLHTIKAPKAFLKRMAHNIIISDKRRQKTRDNYSNTVIQYNQGQVESCEITPEHICDHSEQLSIAAQAIKKMPYKRRHMLLLRRLNDFTYAEIAQKFSVSQSCVKKHVARATKDLNGIVTRAI